ncbi:hypothetical protein EOA32_09530 [Mesorhizobium sp. M1A.F.Ca.ET.072.01.1.1]|nr:hypothetical protein EOA32_09530 [Mesorhizobium sp. M1A.F.Ca.ET.072.01.1.1]
MSTPATRRALRGKLSKPALPSPLPSPRKNGERGRQRWSASLLPVTIRGEGAGRRMRGSADELGGKNVRTDHRSRPRRQT